MVDIRFFDFLLLLRDGEDNMLSTSSDFDVDEAIFMFLSFFLLHIRINSVLDILSKSFRLFVSVFLSLDAIETLSKNF